MNTTQSSSPPRRLHRLVKHLARFSAMMAGSWLAAWLANYAMNYTTPYQQIQGFFFGMIVLAAIGMWRITKPDA